MQLEGPLEQGAVADHQAADLERHRQPLVRVERDRIRLIESFERGAPPRGQRRERPVRTVHVKPDATRATDLRELRQRVDRTGVRRPGIGADEERQTAGRDVGVHRCSDIGRADPEELVRRKDADLVRSEPEVARGAGQG